MRSAVIQHLDDGTPHQALAHRERNLMPSAARTETTNSATQTNKGYRGLLVNVKVTAVSAAAAITFRIVCQFPNGSQGWLWTAAAAINAVGNKTYLIYPGVAIGGDERASCVLGRTWFVQIQHANADSITYSVDVVEIP